MEIDLEILEETPIENLLRLAAYLEVPTVEPNGKPRDRFDIEIDVAMAITDEETTEVEGGNNVGESGMERSD